MLLQTLLDIDAAMFVNAHALVSQRCSANEMHENIFQELKRENTVTFIFNCKTLLWYINMLARTEFTHFHFVQHITLCN